MRWHNQQDFQSYAQETIFFPNDYNIVALMQMTWQQQPSYLCDDQGYFHDDYNFADTTHMSWEARIDAQCQEIEETSKRIKNHIKSILNTLNSEPQQPAQGDYEILTREEDKQIFDVNEQIAQNLSLTAQENSIYDTEITFPIDTDDAQQKGKGKSQVISLQNNE
ncbi:hypothetical protein V6N12_024597 [Hibiscus sabdariffa]|uniref:Uncharacterized protein n=1 Tax=Hibiscus sabdariffa TaxID=183260 RepID=A0ABR2G1I3_9ROSI